MEMHLIDSTQVNGNQIFSKIVSFHLWEPETSLKICSLSARTFQQDLP